MKTKTLATALILTALTASGAYCYTHSTQYVGNAYDNIMSEVCGDSLLCVYVGQMVKPATVQCMKKQFFSTSEKTVEKCLIKVLNDNKA